MFRRVTAAYAPKVQDTPLFNFEIAELYGLVGRSSNAVPFYARALVAQPDFLNVLNNFSWLLATDPDATLRNGGLAVQHATRACELTQWKQPVCMGTLAAAFAEAGQFDQAIATGLKAVQAATAVGQSVLARRNEELLALYRAGKPFHESAPPLQP